jgi:hypothetical protein
MTEWWELNEIRLDKIVDDVMRSLGIDKIYNLDKEITRQFRFQDTVYIPDVSMERGKVLLDYHGTIHLLPDKMLKDMIKASLYAKRGYLLFNLYFMGVEKKFFSPLLMAVMIAYPNKPEYELLVSNFIKVLNDAPHKPTILMKEKLCDDLAKEMVALLQKSVEWGHQDAVTYQKKLNDFQPTLDRKFGEITKDNFKMCLIMWKTGFMDTVSRAEKDTNPETGIVEGECSAQLGIEEFELQPWKMKDDKNQEDVEERQEDVKRLAREYVKGISSTVIDAEEKRNYKKGKGTYGYIDMENQFDGNKVHDIMGVSVDFVLINIMKLIAKLYSDIFFHQMEEVKKQTDWDSQMYYADLLKKYAAHMKLMEKDDIKVSLSTEQLSQFMQKKLRKIESLIK